MVNPQPLSLFSREKLPHAFGIEPNSEMRWFSSDNEERHIKFPHPMLGAEDVVYKFNSYGYRCAEFSLNKANKKTLSVVSIGASEVMGYGLPEDRSFPHLFTKLLENHMDFQTLNWNLGVPGSSSDTMSRMLIPVLSVLKPDIVLLVFPFPWRREHINDAGQVFFFDRNSHRNIFKAVKSRLVNPEYTEQFSANSRLSSDYNDQLNYFKNYQVCESLCEKNNVMWLFSPFNVSHFRQFEHMLMSKNLVSPGMWDSTNRYRDDPGIGLARDRWHPGIKPNQVMAEMFFDRLTTLYSDQLKAYK